MLIYFGFFGLFFGTSFGLLPYTRFLLWLPVFASLSFVTITAEGDLAKHFDVADVTCFAMLVIGAAIILSAALVSFVIGRLERRST